MRIDSHPILHFDRTQPIFFFYNGQKIKAFKGETIASALHASGIKKLSCSVKYNRPRGFFCGIGKCSSCLMRVNGIPNVRTCIVPAENGMTVESREQRNLPSAEFLNGKGKSMDVEILVVGAGPAGVSAAIEAGNHGRSVLLVDENHVTGGQLIKQTHKFFGSKKERAGTRGIKIAEELEAEIKGMAEKGGIKILLGTSVFGYYGKNGKHVLGAVDKMKNILYTIETEKVIFACGAQENMLSFPGNDLPGVYGAGGVQTLMNVYGVKPGNKVLMIGAGNVGLIVSYQLLQAGIEVDRVVEALPKIGGYSVHAAKLRRCGVPIYTSHSVKEVYGEERVEGAIVGRLDEKWNFVRGSEEDMKCDTVCLAVGLTPSARLLFQAGVKRKYIPEAGGYVAIHNNKMETSVDGIYVAGDSSGIEEASTAMLEGKIAGLSAAFSLGHVKNAEELMEEYAKTLDGMREGPFGSKARKAKKKILQEALNEGI
ncbi:MAG: FAD-dependent oxidoreductase [Candidatus Thermoplasmatota archaeon]|nr:FAD-dependent oxidoreductase [Candidatus Thermoplasmatota archaeon]